MFQFHHPKDILLKLSRIIPVPFYCVYGVGHPVRYRERATWWSWRGRVYRHRRSGPLAA